MFLTEVSLSNIVKKQLLYKLQSNRGIFTSLMATQVFGFLFWGGSGGSGSFSDTYAIEIDIYSGNLLIIFTMFWAFASAIQITTKGYRYEDFTFVTNRISSNLSNILFLIVMSFVGGLTVMMASTVLKLAVNLINQHAIIIGGPLPIQHFLLGIVSTSFYLLLLASLGYLVGMLGQVHKIFYILFAGVAVGLLYQGNYIDTFFTFFSEETSILIFTIKVWITAAVLFALSAAVSNRLEVEK